MRKTLGLAALGAIVALSACGVADEGSTPSSSSVVQEDSVGFNCVTDGNQICGYVIEVWIDEGAFSGSYGTPTDPVPFEDLAGITGPEVAREAVQFLNENPSDTYEWSGVEITQDVTYYVRAY